MKQVYDVGGDYLRQEEDEEKFVRAMKRAKIKDTMLKEISRWLSDILETSQRTGPLWTTDARRHAEQKEGPIFPAGALEYIFELDSSSSIPKRRRARG
jgi:hypothetical protein